MASLYQNNTAIPNCTKFTLSTWVRLPTPAPDGSSFSGNYGGVGFSSDISYSFFEFGGLNPATFSTSGITGAHWVLAAHDIGQYEADYPLVSPDPAGLSVSPQSALPDPNQKRADGTFFWSGYYIRLVGSGGTTATDPLYYLGYDSADSTVTDTFPNTSTRLVALGNPSSGYFLLLSVGGTMVLLPDLFGHSGQGKRFQWTGLRSSNGSFQFGQWHHVLIAVDIGSAGYMIKPTWQNLSDSSAKNNTVYMVLNGVTYGGTTVTGQPQLAYVDAPDDSQIPIDPVSGIKVSGSTISIPYNPQASIYSPLSDNVDYPSTLKREYGDTQVWFNKFIDPTDPTNYSKFVSISGSTGTPVDPPVAAAAFGQQDGLFMGDSTHFYVNRGSAGGFTKSGTISNFTPAPSYG